MKLIAFLFVALFAACVKSQAPDFMKMAQDCKASVGASDADVASLMAHQAPSNDAQKCMISCFLEAEGMIKDGSLSKDGIMAFTTKITGGDAAKGAMAAQAFDECNAVSGADKCDTAAKQGWCLKQQGDKMQIMLGV